MATPSNQLLSEILPQLPDWFEGVLNQSAPADDDVGFAFHADSKSEVLSFCARDARFFKRCQSYETRSIAGADCGRAYPIEFSVQRAVTLVRKGLEEVAHFLRDRESRETRFF